MALKCGNTCCKDYDANGYGGHNCRHWFANLPHRCGFVEATKTPPVSPSNSSDLLNADAASRGRLGLIVGCI